MRTEETSLGGREGTFPSTIWSDLVRLRQADAPASRDILGRLVASYWRPVYITIRRGWGKSVEDAKDLTQEFVSRIMTGDLSTGLDPARGRFRDWLKAALRHFLLQAKRDAKAVKRGSLAVVLPLDAMDRIDVPAYDPAGDPALIFDREWGKELFQRAVDQLRREATLADKAPRFEVFRRYDWEPSAGRRSSYRAIAEELGITPIAVRDHLVAARRRLREIVTREIAEYATGPREVQEELHGLLGAE